MSDNTHENTNEKADREVVTHDTKLASDEDAAIDGIDPVYAAKARVLNRAVGYAYHLADAADIADPRDRYGDLPMATVFRDWLRLGAG